MLLVCANFPHFVEQNLIMFCHKFASVVHNRISTIICEICQFIGGGVGTMLNDFHYNVANNNNPLEIVKPRGT